MNIYYERLVLAPPCLLFRSWYSVLEFDNGCSSLLRCVTAIRYNRLIQITDMNILALYVIHNLELVSF